MAPSVPVFILPLVLLLGASLGQEEGRPDEACIKPPPGFPRRPPMCCVLPYPIEDMKSQFPQCLQTVPRPPPDFQPQHAAAHRQAAACLETCVFNRVGFMKSGGKELDEGNIKSKLMKSVTTGWSEIAGTAADTCFAKIKEIKLPEGGSCSEAPVALAHCLRRELYINCPKDMWNDNNDCNMVKKQMEMCPNLPPPPSPGPPPPHTH